MDINLKELGFRKCIKSQAIYIRGESDARITVRVYANGLIVTKNNNEGVKTFNQQMMLEFDMSDLGLLSYYLGIEVEQPKGRILLKQSAYAKKILSQFGMAG